MSAFSGVSAQQARFPAKRVSNSSHIGKLVLTEISSDSEVTQHRTYVRDLLATLQPKASLPNFVCRAKVSGWVSIILLKTAFVASLTLRRFHLERPTRTRLLQLRMFSLHNRPLAVASASIVVAMVVMALPHHWQRRALFRCS
jgi:hypothetical protein